MDQNKKQYLDNLLVYYKKRVNFLVDIKMEILQNLVKKTKEAKIGIIKKNLEVPKI